MSAAIGNPPSLLFYRCDYHHSSAMGLVSKSNAERGCAPVRKYVRESMGVQFDNNYDVWGNAY
jgi:hypothetical protein